MHIVCKALSVMGDLSMNWENTILLYKAKVVKTLRALSGEGNDPSVSREVANLISRMLSKPEGMVLWLKFDSANVCKNSAGNDSVLIVKNQEPKRLPKDYGLYRNWGVMFDQDDILKIAPSGLFLERFTVCLWITLPIVKFSSKAGKRHVILAST